MTIASCNAIYGFCISALEDIDRGPYNLWTYQDYLNKINLALSNAYTSIKTAIGSDYEPVIAPRIIYNASDKLFNLVCDSHYTESKYFIDFNTALQGMFVFPAIADSGNAGYVSMIVQNNGFNVFTGTITYVNVLQEARGLQHMHFMILLEF